MPKLAAFEHTIQTPMRCYGILNGDLGLGGYAAWQWAQTHNLPTEAHLNRCRYWLPTDSALESEFVLRFTSVIHRVPQEDYI